MLSSSMKCNHRDSVNTELAISLFVHPNLLNNFFELIISNFARIRMTCCLRSCYYVLFSTCSYDCLFCAFTNFCFGIFSVQLLIYVIYHLLWKYYAMNMISSLINDMGLLQALLSHLPLKFQKLRW